MLNDRAEFRVYDADNYRNPPWIDGIAGAFQTIRRHGGQIYDAALGELKNRFATTLLGGFWAVVLPLVPISAYLFLRLVLGNPDASALMQPATYVTIGVAAWFLLGDSMQVPIRALGNASKPTSGDSTPLMVTMLIGLMDVWLEFGIRLVLLLLIVVLLEGGMSVIGTSAVVLLLLNSMIFFGIGVYFAFLQLVVPDTVNLLQIALRYGIFFSLAIFPLGEQATAALMFLNPFAIVIDNLRSLLVLGSFPAPLAFALLQVVGLMLLLHALFLLQVADQRVRSLL